MSHKIPNFPSTTGVLRRFICPKFAFGRGSAPDPAGGAHDGGAHDAPPDPLVGWGGGNPIPIPQSQFSVSRISFPESWQPYLQHVQLTYTETKLPVGKAAADCRTLLQNQVLESSRSSESHRRCYA